MDHGTSGYRSAMLGTEGLGRGWPIPDRVVLDEGTSLALRHVPEHAAVVVEVWGLAADGWTDALALELLALDRDLHLVVDVCGATLVSTVGLGEVLAELVAAGRSPHRLCLVCSRMSTLALLRRCGATEQVAVFGSTDDAMLALGDLHRGHGVGWQPSVAI